MISFTVRMKFRPEDREPVAQMLRELTEASRREPGCTLYLPHTVETDPDIVMIYEQYRDAAAAEEHRAAAYFDRLATNGIYTKMLERAIEMLAALV